jgi:hypothetical protein
MSVLQIREPAKSSRRVLVARDKIILVSKTPDF